MIRRFQELAFAAALLAAIALSGPSFAATSTIGKYWIATTTASDSASVTFTTNNVTGWGGGGTLPAFNKMEIDFNDVYPNTNDVQMLIEVTTSAGPTYTWVTTGYQWSAEFDSPISGTPAFDVDGGTSDAAVAFGGSSTASGVANQALGDGSNNSAQGTITISNVNTSSTHVMITYDGTYWADTARGYLVNTHGGGSPAGTDTAITGIKIYMSSGNISGGNFVLYGLSQ